MSIFSVERDNEVVSNEGFYLIPEATSKYEMNV